MRTAAIIVDIFEVPDMASDASLAAERMNIPLWGRLLIKILKWGAGVIFAGFIAIGWQLVSLNRSMGRLEGQIGSMPASIAQSLLEQSKKSADQGNLNDAKRSLQLADALLQNATQNKSKVARTYFETVSQQLNQLKKLPELAPETHNVTLELADYKSALEPRPKLPGNAVRVVNAINPADIKNRVVFQKITPGDFFSIAYVVKSLKNASSIEGPVLEGVVPGVTQTLDGFRWIDSIFINVHIKYEGGEMELRNVTFVNCTFEIVDSPRGNDVTNYIVLGVPQRLLFGATSSQVLSLRPSFSLS